VSGSAKLRRTAALAAAALATATAAGAGASAAPPAGTIAVSRTGGGISLLGADGRLLRTLTTRQDWAPAWSPDGKRLAFTRTTDGFHSFQIYVMRADGSGVRRLTRGRFDERPAWSRDGRWIAYSATDGLRVVRPDGGGGRLVVRERAAVTNASWTADGRIAYSFHPEVRSDWPPSCRTTVAGCGWVLTVRLDGTGRRPVVEGRDAHWSPDGSTIVFTPPNGGVAVVSAAGGKPRALGRGYLADWSTDGNRIVFARLGQTAAGDSIWIENRDGSGRRAVAHRATDPAWQPVVAHAR
jgi:Tol biopolymer transport system component